MALAFGLKANSQQNMLEIIAIPIWVTYEWRRFLHRQSAAICTARVFLNCHRLPAGLASDTSSGVVKNESSGTQQSYGPANQESRKKHAKNWAKNKLLKDPEF